MITQISVCDKCGAQNPVGYDFCGNCGTGLMRKCSNCGDANNASFKYCATCGMALSRPRQTAPAEISGAANAVATARGDKKSLPTCLPPTVLARSLPGAVVATAPKLAPPDVQSAIKQWVAQQSFWPNELTADRLAQNLQVVYLAHWLLSGKGEAHWSATIGKDWKMRTKCIYGGKSESPLRYIFPDHYRAKDQALEGFCEHCHDRGACDGNGTIEKTVTDWSNQTGQVTMALDQLVVENLANALLIQCGKRDATATMIPMTEPNHLVFQPASTNVETGRIIANKAIQKDLANRARALVQKSGDHYRDLKIDYEQARVDVKTWLYPIFVGQYSFEGEERRVEVDGITGQVYAEAPSSVSFKRTILVLGIVALAIAIVLILAAVSRVPQ